MEGVRKVYGSKVKTEVYIYRSTSMEGVRKVCGRCMEGED